jgi:FlaA1/EpsC-like NDP-sugar epimerase
MTGDPTTCLAVRFGNVLGSSGSVLPLFQRQILAGGPITITDPEMVRYFLTAHEAVQLVITAATMGRGGEVFVLDMGEPIKILNLAERMVRLHGLELHEDIRILFTGPRPGEKLFEELVSSAEHLIATDHEKLNVVRIQRQSSEKVREWLSPLREMVGEQDQAGVLSKMQEMVPEYQASETARHSVTQASCPSHPKAR